MAQMKFNKHDRQPKPVKETEAATPKRRFDINEFNQQKKQKTGKKKVGRPRLNKTSRMLRVTKETGDKLNAMKQALGASSHDDALQQIIDYAYKELPEGRKKIYNVLKEVNLQRDEN